MEIMEPINAVACSEWTALIAERANGTLAGKSLARVAAHLDTCAGCAQMAEDMAALRRALGALPARQTSPHFEARLAARLADRDAQRKRASWRTRWAEAWQAGPRAVRPALALGAMALVAGGAAFFEHVTPTAIVTPPSALAADPALLSHCVEQHRTEAAAQPLSDLSAQNLAAQVDGASSADASAGMTNEDGL
jgi:hypothetical protein